MVREHRSGQRFHARFDTDEEPEAEPAGAGPWGDRFRVALRTAGITVPTSVPADLDGPVVAPGAITAVLPADPDEPRRVRIGLRELPDEVWDAVADTLAADPWAAAALARGQVPDALDDAVAAAGGELLPRSTASLPMDCTCADWAMPCAHAAAVLAAAARTFASDPFALVRWRGRERRALRDAVRDRRAARGRDAGSGDGSGDDVELLARWHAAGAPVPDPTGSPTRPDALLDELPPLGTDADPVDDTGRRVDAREALRPLYRRLAADRRRSG